MAQLAAEAAARTNVFYNIMYTTVNRTAVDGIKPKNA
jgi:hypothetical protein